MPEPLSVRRRTLVIEVEDFLRVALVSNWNSRQTILRENGRSTALSKPIPFKGDSRSMLSMTPSDRLVLTVGDIALPSGSDMYVRVFLNKPDANERTSIDDPHYAGSFAFFNGLHEGRTGSAGTFIVDLTEAVGRLKHAGQLLSSPGDPTIQLVGVPHQNRDLAERQFRIGRLELGIVKSLILE
jgi:hypothetical protein